jgi:hypothetical protein
LQTQLAALSARTAEEEEYMVQCLAEQKVQMLAELEAKLAAKESVWQAEQVD